jgi:hypothetical protein
VRSLSNVEVEEMEACLLPGEPGKDTGEDGVTVNRGSITKSTGSDNSSATASLLLFIVILFEDMFLVMFVFVVVVKKEILYKVQKK